MDILQIILETVMGAIWNCPPVAGLIVTLAMMAALIGWHEARDPERSEAGPRPKYERP